jgi:hypothetical protein
MNKSKEINKRVLSKGESSKRGRRIIEMKQEREREKRGDLQGDLEAITREPKERIYRKR